MEHLNYFLIGILIALVHDILSSKNQLIKSNKEISRLNRKMDKIMTTLNIMEFDYNVIDNELREILSTKGQVAAVKRYRDITNATLPEAKKYVDKLLSNQTNNM